MAGAPSGLLCNGCGGDIVPGAQCVAATCHHLFCTNCAQNLVEQNAQCPLCENMITRGNVKLVTALQDSHKVKLLLCGQTPEVVCEAALTAINCYVEQQRLSVMYDNQTLKQQMTKMQAQCKKKLAQMQATFLQAKQKMVQSMQERNALEQDNQELQQKYAQKASQTRKLQEMFKALQQENEELKRQLLGVRGSTAGGVAARSGIPAPRAGGNASRQLSPFGGGAAQMVTTVQHTKTMFDLSPAAGSGMHLLTGHGSAVIGSGNNGLNHSPSGQFGNMFGGGSAHDMGGSGQRPSTAGGMFAPSALGNNRSGRGGGDGNGLRLQGGLNAFSSPAGGMMSL